MSFLNHVHKELTDTSNKVLDAFFWRANIKSHHNPIISNVIYWSFDKKEWHVSPLHEAPKVIDMQFPFGLTDNIKDDIVNLIKNGHQAPVHHELYREAWEQRNENPRSSLVIGISSLEVAIQATIGTLAPDASWLAENTASPPVIKILTEYIPKLPAKNTIKNKVMPPPKSIIDDIKKGVFTRNQIIHLGKTPPENDSLIKLLNSIRDVIWLLDYYRGYEWAYQFIRKETWDELNN